MSDKNIYSILNLIEQLTITEDCSNIEPKINDEEALNILLKNISFKIQKIMKNNNLTQEDLCKITNMSQSNISKIHNRKVIPRIDTLNKIANATNTQLTINNKNNDEDK